MIPISLLSCGRIQRPRFSLCPLLILEGRPRGHHLFLKDKTLLSEGP